MTRSTVSSFDEPSQPESASTLPTKRKGRLTILAIVAIGIFPLIAALYFRYISPPEVRPTVGEMLAPSAFPFELLQSMDGLPLEHPEVSGKWLIVVVAPGVCDERCQNALYLTRQARTAQGRNIARVDRMWLVTDSSIPKLELMAAHPDLIAIRATDASVFQRFGGRANRTINLVDRRGLLVFRYSDDPEPKAFIRELGKLIKF